MENQKKRKKIIANNIRVYIGRISFNFRYIFI